jgi:hypothetical protein
MLYITHWRVGCVYFCAFTLQVNEVDLIYSSNSALYSLYLDKEIPEYVGYVCSLASFDGLLSRMAVSIAVLRLNACEL